MNNKCPCLPNDTKCFNKYPNCKSKIILKPAKTSLKILSKNNSNYSTTNSKNNSNYIKPMVNLGCI